MLKIKKRSSHGLAIKCKNIFKGQSLVFLSLVLSLGTLGLVACSDNKEPGKTVKAKFTFEIVGFEVQFTNESENAARYEWDFGDMGDMNTSTAENPVKTYDEAGEYTVTLKAFDVSDASDSVSHDVNITDTSTMGEAVKAKFSFKANALVVQFTNRSENATRYEWDFGDSTISTDKNPEHEYLFANTFTVTLKAFDGSGASDSVSQDVSVGPTPPLEKLTGSTGGANSSKTWILSRSGFALGTWPGGATHPSLASIIAVNGYWWALGASTGNFTPLHERSCILDDEYTFSVEEGTMKFVVDTKGTFFRDRRMYGGHQGDAQEDETCVLESDADIWKITRPAGEGETLPDSDGDGEPDMRDYRNKSGDSNKGGYTFDLMGDNLTINGAGSYIGLVSKSDEGAKGYLVPASRSFKILKLTDTDASSPDELILSMPFKGGAGAYFIFSLLHYDSGILPSIPRPQPLALPVRFEIDTPIEFNGFSGGSGEFIANPNMTGNTSARAAKLTDNGLNANAGVFFDLATAIDFSTNCGLKMKVYGRSGLTVRFKLEIGDRGTPIEVSQSLGAENTWETLSFDFRSMVSTTNTMKYNRLVFFLGTDTEKKAENLHIDDIEINTNVGVCTGS